MSKASFWMDGSIVMTRFTVAPFSKNVRRCCVIALSAMTSRTIEVIHGIPRCGIRGSVTGVNCATSSASRKSGLCPECLPPG
jgi:hypothetical protein